jgi:hypothetical protein
VHDTGIRVVVCAGERDARRQGYGAVASDLNLYAVRVELCAAIRILGICDVAFVQGNHFGSNQIPTYTRA